MDWIKEAESELRNYTKIQESIAQNSETLSRIDRDITSLRGVRLDGTPVSGGSCGRENWLVDNISRKTELEMTVNVAEKQIEMVERGLLALSEEERKILRLFYIDRPKGYIDILCEELGYEQSSLYYRKDTALRKYTLAVYGMTDT